MQLFEHTFPLSAVNPCLSQLWPSCSNRPFFRRYRVSPMIGCWLVAEIQFAQHVPDVAGGRPHGDSARCSRPLHSCVTSGRSPTMMSGASPGSSHGLLSPGVRSIRVNCVMERTTRARSLRNPIGARRPMPEPRWLATSGSFENPPEWNAETLHRSRNGPGVQDMEAGEMSAAHHFPGRKPRHCTAIWRGWTIFWDGVPVGLLGVDGAPRPCRLEIGRSERSEAHADKPASARGEAVVARRLAEDRRPRRVRAGGSAPTARGSPRRPEGALAAISPTLRSFSEIIRVSDSRRRNGRGTRPRAKEQPEKRLELAPFLNHSAMGG